MPLGDWLPKGSDRFGRTTLSRRWAVPTSSIRSASCSTFRPGSSSTARRAGTPRCDSSRGCARTTALERVQCLPGDPRPSGWAAFLPLRASRRPPHARGERRNADALRSHPVAAPDAARPGHASPGSSARGTPRGHGPAGDEDPRRRPARRSTRTTRTPSRVHFRRVVVLVVGCTFLALFAGFRSLLVASRP